MRKLFIFLLVISGILSFVGCNSTNSTTKYHLTIKAAPSEGGTVSPASGKYKAGESLDISATPADSNWIFDHWSGDYQDSSSTATIIVDSDKNIIAHFVKTKPFHIATNGVTVKCPKANFGDTGIVSGVTYTKRKKEQITPRNAATTCTSGITNMEELFKGADSFNADISSWDVSNVTNMHGLFYGAESFNQDLNSWDVGKVSNMRSLFYGASSFNGDISGWDVSSVKNMKSMFNRSESFNQGLNKWDVSNVTNMNYLFNRASSFNGDISSWDVRKVTKMRNLFYRDESFNGDISGWDVSNVNNMRSMFNRAFSFNQGIGDWDVSSVTKMKYMLHKATVFNQDLSGWCVENISVEPTGFSSGSSLAIHNEPVWGYCNSTIFSEHKHIQAWKPGNAFSDEHGWIEVGVGDMPLVISAPHGGTRKPKNIPDRTCGKGGGVTVADSHVGKLAFVIRRQLKIQNNKQPYVIVAGIARSKVDLNRNLENATCGNKKMKDAWRRYHDNIDKALAKAVKKFGYAIFIDLHGQGHKKHRLELGYKPTKKQIKEMYLDSDKAEGIANKTSLANLLNMNSELNITELIWGKNSFGTLIAKKGFPAVPSRQDPYPLQGDPYFDGGYNTRRYTSSKYPRVFGWQIESNYKGVRDAKGRPKFAEAFAKVIMTYINENIKK